MKRKGYFTEFYLQIDKQARRLYDDFCVSSNGSYVTPDMPVASGEYKDKTTRLLREFVADNNSTISIKEYFGKTSESREIEKAYICQAFNRYLSEQMGLSDDQIKGYFYGKSITENSRAYYEHFRTFFIRQKLLTMGDILSREQVENRIKRARLNLSKLNSAGDMVSDIRRECEGDMEAYKTALEYMQHAQIGRIDLFALFNAHATTVYVPKGEKLNPKDKLVEVFLLDGTQFEEDIIARD